MTFFCEPLRTVRVSSFSFLLLLFLFYDLPIRAQNEVLHQRILAGEQISLAASDSESARTIDAKWIKEAALKGVKIEIYRAVIQGPLDVEDVTFEQGLTLASCILKDDADFSHAIFKRDFIASDTTFRSWVSFRGVSFEHDATLQRARFEAPIAFDDAHFLEVFDATEVHFAKNAGTVTFTRVRFDRTAVFAFTIFDADVHFISAQFAGEGFFPGARFGRQVSFQRARFFDITTFGSGLSHNKYNATFVGKAFFTEAQFDSTVGFQGVVFDSDVDFSNARFLSLAAFGETIFKLRSTFSRVQFGSYAQFTRAEFLNDAAFDSAQFNNVADFSGGNKMDSGAIFGARAIFQITRFRGFADFQGVEFRRSAEFVDAAFENDAYFVGTIFEGDAAFDRVQIMGAALYSPKDGVVTSKFAQSARFLNKGSFSGAQFGSGVRFTKVRFDGPTDFGGTRFGGDAHFEGSEFIGPTSFRSAAFRVLYLSGPETGKQQQFKSDIDLLGCTYDRIQVDWRSLLRYPTGQSRVQPYDRQPYIELEAVLRKSGSDEDADAVYAERRRAESQKSKGSSKIKNYLYWLTANYGIDLSHEFIIASLFLGIGAFLFAQAGAVLLGESGSEDKISWYQALAVAVRQFLPFGLPVKSIWTPSRRIIFMFVSPAVYANFLQLLGWLLIPLAVAWFAGFLRHGAQ